MRKKVCMVVPSFTAKGGITAVVNGYQNSQLTEDYDVRFIETYCDGNKIKKVAIYLKSMFKYLYALIFWRAEIIHIHSSFGGSFYRKKFFIVNEQIRNFAQIPITGARCAPLQRCEKSRSC